MPDFAISLPADSLLYGPLQGRLWNTPLVPENTVERPDILTKLRGCLLNASLPELKKPKGCLLSGEEGSGKTTLALALAYDVSIRTRFRDGICWLSLGQEPDLLVLLGDLIEVFDPWFKMTTVSAASAHLQRLLAEKSVLLILDAAWKKAHLQPFLVEGALCRFLITTPHPSLVEETEVRPFAVAGLKPKQALKLFTNVLQRDLAANERRQALRLAEAVDYLPLPLQLAAAHRRNDTETWAVTLQSLRQEAARLKAPESRRLGGGQESLEATLLQTLYCRQTEDGRTLAQFAELGIVAAGATLTPPLLAILWQTDIQTAADRLKQFCREALLIAAAPITLGGQTYPTYRMHAALHAMAQRLCALPPPDGLGMTSQQAHRHLLAHYRNACKPRGNAGDWAGLPIDGYIQAHLAWHLEQAGQFDRLCSLLQEETTTGRNAWFQIRASLGQRAGYAADVRRALHWAHMLSCQQHEHGEPLATLGLELRFMLMLSALNSLESTLPVEWIVKLIRYGLWSSETSLAAVRRIRVEEHGTEDLVSLLPWLAPEALPKALVVAREIQRYDLRLKARNAVAVALATAGKTEEALAATHDTEHPEASFSMVDEIVSLLVAAGKLEEVLEALSKIVPLKFRSDLFTALTPYMTTAQLQARLPEVRANRIASYRCYDLRVIVSELARRGLPEEARSVALEIDSLPYRADAFVGLALYLADPVERAQAFTEALSAARRIRYTVDKARSLAYTASRIAANGQAQEALSVAREIKRDVDCIEALRDMARFLTVEQLRRACILARRRKHPYFQALGLGALAVRLPDREERNAVLVEARSAAHRIKEGRLSGDTESSYTVIVLREIASLSAAAGQADEAFAAVSEIADSFGRQSAFGEIARTLVKAGNAEEALSAAQRLKTSSYRQEVLDSVPTILREVEQKSQVQPVGRKSAEPGNYSLYAPRKRKQILLETLDTTFKIQETSWRGGRVIDLVSVLERMAPLLTEQQLQGILPVVRETENSYNPTADFCKIVAHLDDPEERAKLVSEELARVCANEPSFGRAHDIGLLAAYLTDAQLQKVVLIARKIEDPEERYLVFKAIGPRLIDPKKRAWAVSRALAAGPGDRRRYGVPYRRVEAQIAIVSSLAEAGHTVEALALAHTIDAASPLVRTLSILLPYLTDAAERAEVLQEMRVVAAMVEEPSARASAFLLLLPHLTLPTERAALASETLALIRQSEEAHFRSLALNDIMPYLTDPAERTAVVSEVLAAARIQKEAIYSVEALSRIAPYVADPEERTQILAEALSRAQEILYDEHEIRAFRLLAPQLTSEQLQEALVTIDRPEAFPLREQILRRALARLRDMTATETFCSVWAAFVQTAVSLPRENLLDILPELTPVLIAHGDEQTMEEVIQALQHVMRWW